MAVGKQAFLDEAKVREWHDAIDRAIEDMKKLCENGIVSAFGENVAVSRLATQAIQGARGLVETETLSLMDTMAAAFDETSGAIAKLKAANKRLSDESMFLASTLAPIQRKTVEISEYASQIERLNGAMDVLKQHIDSGLFDVAARCAKAIER